MKYSEFFYTIQGEGKLIGVPSVFFRTSFCNLRCVWCVVEDTRILMADLTEKPIQDICIGEDVLSVDLKQRGILCKREVTDTYSRSVSNLVKVATQSDEVITTPNHKFKTQQGWTQAQNLSMSAGKIPIATIPDTEDYYLGYLMGALKGGTWAWQDPTLNEINASKTDVFNLTVEGTHCYFANRFLVANCDTPFTSWEPENKDISIPQAVEAITKYGCKHVVITGGEPFVQVKELADLCQALDLRGHHITIETNATIFAPVAAHLISMSPKLENSNPPGDNRYFRRHERGRIRSDVVRTFLDQYACQVKFVVDCAEDLQEIKALQAEIPIPTEAIVLMPQGMTPEELNPKQEWLVEICKEYGYRYSPRVHVDIWGNRRGV